MGIEYSPPRTLCRKKRCFEGIGVGNEIGDVCSDHMRQRPRSQADSVARPSAAMAICRVLGIMGLLDYWRL
jgi:hypothetical protein